MNKVKIWIGYATCIVGTLIGFAAVPFTFVGACLEVFHELCWDLGHDLIVDGRWHDIK